MLYKSEFTVVLSLVADFALTVFVRFRLLQCQLRNSAASEFSRCGRRRALTRFEAARRRRPVPLLPHRRRRGWQLTRAQAGQSLRSPQSAAVMSSTSLSACYMVTGRAAGSLPYAPHGGRSQLSRQRRTLVTCVLASGAARRVWLRRARRMFLSLSSLLASVSPARCLGLELELRRNIVSKHRALRYATGRALTPDPTRDVLTPVRADRQTDSLQRVSDRI